MQVARKQSYEVTPIELGFFSHCNIFCDITITSYEMRQFLPDSRCVKTKMQSYNKRVYFYIVKYLMKIALEGRHNNKCTGTLLNRTITAQWEGMGDVGSARYDPHYFPHARP